MCKAAHKCISTRRARQAGPSQVGKLRRSKDRSGDMHEGPGRQYPGIERSLDANLEYVRDACKFVSQRGSSGKVDLLGQTFSVTFSVQNQQTSCSDWQTLFRTRGNFTLTSAAYLWNMPPYNRLILCSLLIVTGFRTYPEHSPI
jgi:hypothetical protein